MELVTGKQRNASSRREARRKLPVPASVGTTGQKQKQLAEQAEEQIGDFVACEDRQNGRQESGIEERPVERGAGNGLQMGDEEFARFDALVAAAPPPTANWQGAKEIDRQSLLLGLGAGALLFVLILLFY